MTVLSTVFEHEALHQIGGQTRAAFI